ncbi:hypothetical protein SADUNF_Sadunf10G0052700 [Salix dunnii]|uniref:Uncharacterized protein n=1 Tax=Salix dunnii TaxID=1413687 RepID=A0A835JM03_9ROSI|nr:hypothetical protein SADUNF_Sadunf10G0052700 [Salix dunnii]
MNSISCNPPFQHYFCPPTIHVAHLFTQLHSSTVNQPGKECPLSRIWNKAITIRVCTLIRIPYQQSTSTKFSTFSSVVRIGPRWWFLNAVIWLSTSSAKGVNGEPSALDLASSSSDCFRSASYALMMDHFRELAVRSFFTSTASPNFNNVSLSSESPSGTLPLLVDTDFFIFTEFFSVLETEPALSALLGSQ